MTLNIVLNCKILPRDYQVDLDFYIYGTFGIFSIYSYHHL